jgi:hypothetical protein
MALTHRVSTTVRSNAGSVTSTSYTLTGTHEFNLEKTFAIGTDVAQDLEADVSTIVSLAMVWEPATGSSSCTIETNSSSAADDTITLAADTPLIWNTTIESSLGTVCPLTTDITTGIFVTNSVAGDLSIYILYNGS